MKNLMVSLAILTALLSLNAYSANPTAAHINMSKHMESGLQWTKHLREEIRKGAKSDPKEIEGDLAGVLSFLSAMNLTAEQIIIDSPAEMGEGHFMEMRKYQTLART